jgi:DNA repair protein RecN (Recombination protein N)
VVEVLQGALAQLDDATHTLNAYLGRAEPDPGRLAELDARMAAWMSLARRWRRPPAELPALRAGWQAELQALDAAADVPALERAAAEGERAYREQAARVSAQRRAAAPPLAAAVSAAMQTLGMDGGRFEVALPPAEEPQAHGLESVEFLVAGHAGSTPRPLGRVASGGELSRLALAIATTTATGVSRTDPTAIGVSRTDTTAIGAARPDSTATSAAKASPKATGAAAAPQAESAAADTPPTLIFDEIDAGIGGRVADSVGRLMQRLGRSTQVLAVTHLAQVAACADRHLVVTKSLQGAATVSAVQPVAGEARVAEIARMLGGERLAADTSRAHAEAMLGSAEQGR